MTISTIITQRIKNANKRYWAGDNISAYLHDGDKEGLIEEGEEFINKYIVEEE